MNCTGNEINFTEYPCIKKKKKEKKKMMFMTGETWAQVKEPEPISV